MSLLRHGRRLSVASAGLPSRIVLTGGAERRKVRPVQTRTKSLRALVALGALLFTLTIGSSAAWAGNAPGNPDYNRQPPPAGDTSTSRPPMSQLPFNGGSSGRPSNRSWLPVTGTDVAELAALGVALVVSGGVVIAARRRLLV